MRKPGPVLSQKIKPRLNELPLQKFIPNLITLVALCAGLSSVRFALVQKWELSVILILGAMVLDGLDGRVARLLKSTSKFGAELDSLADFCNFGIVPGIVIYHYSLQSLGRLGWPISLIYTICMVLRLARFNTLIDNPSNNPNYFIGVPAPFGAFLVLTPMILHFHLENLYVPPEGYGAWVLLVSSLLVSRLRTFSFKKGKIARKYILPVFLAAALVAAALVALPWLTLALIAVVYICLIPASGYYFKKSKLQELPSKKPQSSV